jgi:hypothetical protein
LWTNANDGEHKAPEHFSLGDASSCDAFLLLRATVGLCTLFIFGHGWLEVVLLNALLMAFCPA